jgi:hypothetical protein
MTILAFPSSSGWYWTGLIKCAYTAVINNNTYQILHEKNT